MKAVNVNDVLKILHKYGTFIFVTDSKKYSDMENEIANLPSVTPKQRTGKWIHEEDAMITEQEMMRLKRGDKVLVKCTVEAVFVKSGMVMVTTRDCDKGFDAYEDEVICVMPDKVTKGESE